MHKTQCQQCSKTFIISQRDEGFYKRIDVPLPKLCPGCRAQARLSFRNDRSLYPDKCDMCGKSIISIYSPGKPNRVYCDECFQSDQWSPLDYGRDIDFTRPFFEQFKELQDAVPHINLIKESCENCDFVNTVGYSKNCYLIHGSINCEDCYYGNPYYCKSCVDVLFLTKSELCYECIASENLYNCVHCQDCYDSNNLVYCYDVRGSSDLIGCVGLRNQKYQVFNQQHTQAEFERYKEKFKLCDPEQRALLEKNFNKLKSKHPRRYMMGIQNENVIGNYVNHAKDSHYCYDATGVDNVNYAAQIVDSRDMYDVNNVEDGELCYQVSGANQMRNGMFSNMIWSGSDIWYSVSCNTVHDVFGCVSLHSQESYVILNKQYTKDEYTQLKTRLIEHMKETGEWGEFFSIASSRFAYNETVAQEHFPITEDDAKNNGWPWKSEDPKQYQPQKYRVVNDIQNMKEDICQTLLACMECKRNYQIISQELAFYKQMNLPIPKLCPNCRHMNRLALRSPRAVWQRQCMCTIAEHRHSARCQTEFTTSYSPEGKELVFCSECYSAEI